MNEHAVTFWIGFFIVVGLLAGTAGVIEAGITVLILGPIIWLVVKLTDVYLQSDLRAERLLKKARNGRQ